MKDTSEFGKDESMKTSWRKKAHKLVKRRLPIIGWIRRYTKKDLISDAIAGITVGLTVVPQSMAYAAIVGLSPEYGLYSSYVGVLTYILLGTCAQATIGPTAVMELLTFQICGPNYPACVILTGFYSGVFELLLAMLRLGWIVSFISEPVTVGFTAGAAMTILSSQIKNFFGIKGSKGNGFLGYWKKVFSDYPTISMADSVMGICAFVTLILLKKLKDIKPSENKFIKTTLWLTSLSRNVIVIVVTSIIAWAWSGHTPFQLVGNVQGGFPSVALPQFRLPVKRVEDTYYYNLNNQTYNETSMLNMTISTEGGDDTYLSFMESCQLLKTGPLVIALISILQNVAISKAFGAGGKVDATQEMIALGVSSVLGGCCSAMPISASFSRSAVNDASGVRTQMGILVILSLGFLTPSFYYIPKASLSAVIIAAVMVMIEYESIIPMWRISKMDAIACLITFACSLFLGMEYGIVIGVCISVGGILLKSLKPELTPEIRTDSRTGINYLVITPSKSGIHFPSIDHVSSTIQKLCLKHKSCRVIVLNFCHWSSYDYSGASTFVSLVKGMKKNGRMLLFMNCSPEWVKVLGLAGLQNVPAISGDKEEADLSAHLSRLDKEELQGIDSQAIGVSNRTDKSVEGVIAGVIYTVGQPTVDLCRYRSK
ncbi:Sodium-independent sulfate anion transporter [Folsomia candida]|uniref:Sodium-independent sulfate anion transporter n=1 Tax=Folsomia candida TaxID=158441 RepID=A0A226F449_FOLCA|nr:Sodium-independent sulfate anion transporter [Folsomia candida]